MRKKYETDLTDEQWEVIKPLFVNMRKRKWEKRELVNAVLYLVKTGCQWRNLPHDFPPVFTVHSFYRRARLNGLWDRILAHLVKLTRQKVGLSEEPTQALIDSQSVKTTGAVEQKSFDMEKKEWNAKLSRMILVVSYPLWFTRPIYTIRSNRLGNFRLYDVEENQRGWRLSRFFRFRGVQIFWLANRNKQEVEAARLSSLTKALDSWESICLAESFSPT